MNPYSYVMNNPLTDSDPFGLCGLFSCPGKAIGSFFSHAFAGPAGNVRKAVIVIAAVGTFQLEVLPALVGPMVLGAEEGSVVLTGFSALAYTSPLAAAAVVAAAGTASAGYGDNPFWKAAVAGLGGGTGAALTGGRFGDGFYLAASAAIVTNLFGRRVSSDQSWASPGEIIGGSADANLQRLSYFIPFWLWTEANSGAWT